MRWAALVLMRAQAIDKADDNHRSGKARASSLEGCRHGPAAGVPQPRRLATDASSTQLTHRAASASSAFSK